METIRVLRIEPGEAPEDIKIAASTERYQQEVDGYIECVYPWDDDVCIMCNEEGKINGLPFNRSLKDEGGEVYDVIAGTFLIIGTTETGDSFRSLTDAEAQKYKELFKYPEIIISIGRKIQAYPVKV